MSTVIHPKIHSCCALLNKALVFVSLLYFPAKVEELSSKSRKKLMIVLNPSHYIQIIYNLILSLCKWSVMLLAYIWSLVILIILLFLIEAILTLNLLLKKNKEDVGFRRVLIPISIRHIAGHFIKEDLRGRCSIRYCPLSLGGARVHSSLSALAGRSLGGISIHLWFISLMTRKCSN